PQIVHFSSHGTPDDLILESGELLPDVIEDSDPGHRSLDDRELKAVPLESSSSRSTSHHAPRGVSKSALVNVLRACDEGNLRLLVLNACHTRSQAEVLTTAVDCVVSMNRTISDRAAIKF